MYGRSNETLIYSTVNREFVQRLEERPDEIAYASHVEDKQVTLRQLDHDVNKLCKALVQKYGVKRGDAVGIFAYNCYAWVVAQFACSRLSAVMTPINPSYKANELEFALRKGKVSVLLMMGPNSPHAELNNHMAVLLSDKVREASRANELQLRHVLLMDTDTQYEIVKNDKATGRNIQSGDRRIEFGLANCELWNWADAQNDGQVFDSVHDAELAGVRAEDACIIPKDLAQPEDLFAVYYTSGTTGKPKGACVSQFTVLNNTRMCNARIRAGRSPDWPMNFVTTLPMFHIFAGVLTTLGPILGNSKVVYSSYKYDIKAFVEAAIKHECNLSSLTPTIIIDLLTYIEQNKLQQVFPLRVLQSGGAALSPEIMARAFKVLPNLEDFRCGYGSTENGAVATLQTVHEPMQSRPENVGPPLDYTEVRIVDPATNRILPLGQRGEVQTRGYNTMIEYLDEPQKTQEVLLPARWYRTGDIGFLHPHGSLEISARLKSLIIKGGENIYPEEVEQLIHALECVEDAHVMGVPDKRFGEQVCAWVKLRPGYYATSDDRVDGSTITQPADAKSAKLVTKDEIINYCKENITYFKVPKYLFFVDDFPKTPTKKVQSHIMTDMSVKMLKMKNE